MSTTLRLMTVVCCWLLMQTQAVSAAKSLSEADRSSSSPAGPEVKAVSKDQERRFLNPNFYGTSGNQLSHLAQYFEDSMSSSESTGDGLPNRCKVDSKKRWWRPSKSFPEKKLPPPDKVFRSAHAGQDLVVCWTETITMREDRTGSFPNRMIHREYTISFETSAIIPEEHLDCPRVPNEIETSSEETAKYGVFEEAILDNTRQSRFMPYALREEENDITKTEQKIVRCASGSYVVRELQEWRKDGGKPIQRMEITVKPHIKYADGHPQARVPAEDPLDELFNIDCTLHQTPENFTTTEPPTSTPTTPNSEERTQEDTTPTPPEEEEITTYTGSTATPPSAEMTCDNTTGRCGFTEETTTPTLPTTVDETEPDDNITTTAETRSTWPIVIRPKLILKINVVLERINENEEKEQLMQVDKEVALRDDYGNHTIMDKIKALNASVNDIETLKDLLNLLNDVGKSKEAVNRRRRNAPDLHSVKKHLQNVRAVEQSLPDIRDDIQTGLNEIVAKIERKDEELRKMAVYPTKASNFERQRRSVDDDAVGRWSNVRVKNAAGDRIRSFTELVVVEH